MDTLAGIAKYVFILTKINHTGYILLGLFIRTFISVVLGNTLFGGPAAILSLSSFDNLTRNLCHSTSLHGFSLAYNDLSWHYYIF
jgi:hypothetical protein